jgi:hypothetical protein
VTGLLDQSSDPRLRAYLGRRAEPIETV